jgi:hypothetical protein
LWLFNKCPLVQIGNNQDEVTAKVNKVYRVHQCVRGGVKWEGAINGDV